MVSGAHNTEFLVERTLIIILVTADVLMITLDIIVVFFSGPSITHTWSHKCSSISVE